MKVLSYYVTNGIAIMYYHSLVVKVLYALNRKSRVITYLICFDSKEQVLNHSYFLI
jgi:hypothetical protein